MKRVLVIANLADASPRIPSLTRFFKNYDWEVTIVTPRLQPEIAAKFAIDSLKKHAVRVIETEYPGDTLQWMRRILCKLGLKKNASFSEQIQEKLHTASKKSFVYRLIYLYESIFSFPDSESPWIKPAKKFLKQFLRNEHFDAVISSSPYPTTHVIAQWIRKNFSIPWIAEFRDGWSDNHNYPYGRLRKTLDRHYEKKNIADSEHIVIALPKLASVYSKRYGKPVSTIFNGYLPEHVSQTAELPTELTITYTGIIYEKYQDVSLFFEGLSRALAQTQKPPKLAVNFLGKEQVWVKEQAKKFNLNEVVHFKGVVSHQESLKAQHSSHVLLILGWTDAHDTGNYPTKFFEYMGAQRPMFICGGPAHEDIKKILLDAHAGFTSSSLEQTVEVFLQLFKVFKEKKTIPYDANATSKAGGDTPFKSFSNSELAHRYCTILDSVRNAPIQ